MLCRYAFEYFYAELHLNCEAHSFCINDEQLDIFREYVTVTATAVVVIVIILVES